MGHGDDSCKFSKGVALVDGADLPVFSVLDGPVEGEGTSDPLSAMMFDGKQVKGVVWPRLGPWLVTTRITATASQNTSEGEEGLREGEGTRQ